MKLNGLDNLMRVSLIVNIQSEIFQRNLLKKNREHLSYFCLIILLFYFIITNAKFVKVMLKINEYIQYM